MLHFCCSRLTFRGWWSQQSTYIQTIPYHKYSDERCEHEGEATTSMQEWTHGKRAHLTGAATRTSVWKRSNMSRLLSASMSTSCRSWLAIAADQDSAVTFFWKVTCRIPSSVREKKYRIIDHWWLPPGIQPQHARLSPWWLCLPWKGMQNSYQIKTENCAGNVMHSGLILHGFRNRRRIDVCYYCLDTVLLMTNEYIFPASRVRHTNSPKWFVHSYCPSKTVLQTHRDKFIRRLDLNFTFTFTRPPAGHWYLYLFSPRERVSVSENIHWSTIVRHPTQGDRSLKM